MKSLFSRLRHKDHKSSTRPTSSISLDKASDAPQLPGSGTSSRSSSFSVTNRRSSTPIAALHSQSSSSSSSSTRPHSVTDLPIVDENGLDLGDDDFPEGDETIRIRTLSADGLGVKKVTFRSPIPTPIASAALDGPYQLTRQPNEPQAESSEAQHRPVSPVKRPSLGILGLGRSSSAQSRSSSRASLPLAPRPKPIILRKGSVPAAASTPVSTSPSKSSQAMSPVPSEMSMATGSTRSYLPPPESWSEMAGDDLIANLGPRERTRQEVLWEIVSSEERYVQEIIKLNDTFCRALLPPSAASPSLNLFDPQDTLTRALSPLAGSPIPTSPHETHDFLPIAAQYASTATPQTTSSARLHAYNILTNGRPNEVKEKSSSTSLHSARNHRSLPPSSRDGVPGGVHQVNRMSYHPGGAQANARRDVSGSSTSSVRGQDVHLPEDLGKVLNVLANGVLEGHLKLSAALRKRYENQYPLVRSLADVFTAHSYILREYATYVLHLEKALEQVDEALATYTACMNKRSSRHLENTEEGRLGKTLLALEELAAQRGESGLAISLSKPFQRLLKYPLLFQNLLFNTDPSLKEYEATLKMVDEVEEIVRTIEDEKASSEERERTRDAWARIDGLDKDKLLMAPKANRLLVSETQIVPDVPKGGKDTTKQRRSLKRLSEILRGGHDHADLWIVRFSDVSLVCAKLGTTTLPVSTFKSKAARSDSLPELSGRSKYATTGRRTASVKTRNLYKFVRVHEWHGKQKTGSERSPSEKDIREDPEFARVDKPARPERDLPSVPASPRDELPQNPLTVPLKGDGGPSPVRSTPKRRETDTETMTSDRLSVMSFAFKGSDQIKPVARKRISAPPGQPASAGTVGQRRTSGGYTGKEANAKFAHRLRSPDLDHPTDTLRPGSRARSSLPPAMAQRSISQATAASGVSGRNSPALAPADRNTVGARPAWNSSTKPLKGSPSKNGVAARPASVASVRSKTAASSGAGAKRSTSKVSSPSSGPTAGAGGRMAGVPKANAALNGRQLGGRI